MIKKPAKPKAKARVSMKARIAALDRAALVQRLQDVGEHQKAALFKRNTSDEINRLHGSLAFQACRPTQPGKSKSAVVSCWKRWISLRRQRTCAISQPSSAVG